MDQLESALCAGNFDDDRSMSQARLTSPRAPAVIGSPAVGLDAVVLRTPEGYAAMPVLTVPQVRDPGQGDLPAHRARSVAQAAHCSAIP
jgi:hypothetical protein